MQSFIIGCIIAFVILAIMFKRRINQIDTEKKNHQYTDFKHQITLDTTTEHYDKKKAN